MGEKEMAGAGSSSSEGNSANSDNTHPPTDMADSQCHCGIKHNNEMEDLFQIKAKRCLGSFPHANQLIWQCFEIAFTIIIVSVCHMKMAKISMHSRIHKRIIFFSCIWVRESEGGFITCYMQERKCCQKRKYDSKRSKKKA